MLDIDLGIDDGHQHIIAGGYAMDVGKPQLADHVLGGIAPWRRCEDGRRRRGARVLLQPVYVII
jgi:hypothetical protein